MKNLNTFTKIAAKVFEVGHWVGAALMAASAVCAAAAPQALRFFTDALEGEGKIDVYGFELAAPNGFGGELTALCLFFAASAVIFSLMAMLFRNLWLIIKKSEGSTPFQKDNIRMVREMGIFSASVPVVGLLMSGVLRLVAGVDALETSVSVDGFVMGVVILCLTQVFSRGLELENDVDGLL